MRKSEVNQHWYDQLGDDWYESEDSPIALLRAEMNFRLPWIRSMMSEYFPNKVCTIVDIGCGAGLLSNEIAKDGHSIIGIDISISSLKVALKYDSIKQVNYLASEANHIALKDGVADVVYCMDVLEHVESPQKVIEEAARVLQPGGLFLFYTFNRTWRSWFFAMKAIEWFFKNAPKHLHVYHLFIKPQELNFFCEKSGLKMLKMVGVQPRLNLSHAKTILFTGLTPKDLEFKKTTNLSIGYAGVARKLL